MATYEIVSCPKSKIILSTLRVERFTSHHLRITYTFQYENSSHGLQHVCHSCIIPFLSRICIFSIRARPSNSEKLFKKPDFDFQVTLLMQRFQCPL